MALLAVTDDPEHRFRCAVCKYGDCDILTSWAQGDREGVQDLERMMGHRPRDRRRTARARPCTGSTNVAGAAADRARRARRAGQPEAVRGARRGAAPACGKTFEYVTYPTEAHGFLRVGPQLDFYRRLERFLDWYLM